MVANTGFRGWKDKVFVPQDFMISANPARKAKKKRVDRDLIAQKIRVAMTSLMARQNGKSHG